MKKAILFSFISVFALYLISCEQNVTTTIDELQESGERISFLKTSSYSAVNDDQDPFQMLYAQMLDDTTVNFIMEYMIGEEYNLHNFDFVWDGKLRDDADGNKWMDIDIYHKTKEENKLKTVSDSAYVYIHDLLSIKDEDKDKLWLKLVNTSDRDNVITIKYKQNDDTGTGDEDDSDDNTPVDSSGISSINVIN